MYAPFVLRSDLLTASKQRLVTGCYCSVELLPQLSLSDNFATLDNWNVTQSTVGNVAVSGGVVSFNGNVAFATNGIALKTGITTKIGFLEFKIKLATFLAQAGLLHVNATGALPTTVIANNTIHTNYSVSALRYYLGPEIVAFPSFNNDWETVRIYISKSDGVWKRIKFTLQNSTLTTETTLSDSSYPTLFALGDTIYPCIQRHANDANNLFYVKEFRAYMGGYPTDAPATVFIADAGAANTWENFNLTSLAFPAGFSNANATIKWAFHSDSSFATRTMSNALTLAQLNAVGKQTARQRYMELHVLQNSDGDTQSLATELNAADATDSGGTAGEVTVPPAGHVWDGSPPYGNIAVPTTPLRVDALEADVRYGSEYGDPGDPLVGQLGEPPPDGDSIVAQLLAAFRTDLAGLTTANGYTFSVAKVDDERMYFNPEPRPYVFIQTDTGDTSEEEDQNRILCNQPIIVKCILDGNDETSTDTALVARYKNVAADIWHVCMHGASINALSFLEHIKVEGYDTTIDEETQTVCAWVRFVARVWVDSKNPYLAG